MPKSKINHTGAGSIENENPENEDPETYENEDPLVFGSSFSGSSFSTLPTVVAHELLIMIFSRDLHHEKDLEPEEIVQTIEKSG